MSKSRDKKAVALKYSAEQDMAPVVIASGYGEIAERIIDIAEQKGIPVYRDDSAASLMCMLDVGSNIPTELYEVIAVIYGQIMQTAAEIKNKFPEKEDYPTLSDRHTSFAKKRSSIDEFTPFGAKDFESIGDGSTDSNIAENDENSNQENEL